MPYDPDKIYVSDGEGGWIGPFTEVEVQARRRMRTELEWAHYDNLQAEKESRVAPRR